MIKSGVDIIQNSRFDKYVEDSHFLEKVFSMSELKYRDKLRSIFVIKEATIKCLGKKVNWKSISVSYNDSRPKIILDENIKPKKFKSIDCSVSHDGDYTIGFVIMELEE